MNPFVLDRLERDFSFSPKGAKCAVDLFFLSKPIKQISSTGVTVEASMKFLVLDRLNSFAGLGLRPHLLEELRLNRLESSEVGLRSFSNPVVFEDR